MCVFVAAAVVLCAGFAVTNFVAVKKYWAQPHIDEAEIDADKFESVYSQYDASLDATEATVIECNKVAVPLDESCAAFIAACNDLIIGFF